MTERPSGTLVDLVVGVAGDIAANADQLNRLDAVAGDGDLGVTASRISRAVAEVADVAAALDTPGALRQFGMSIARSAPSTAGTLIAFAFLAAAKTQAADDASGAARRFAAACRAIADRGNVTVGDRTIVDALLPASEALTGALDEGRSLSAAVTLAAGVADARAAATASMAATVGRAAWLAERAQGSEDGGARLAALALSNASRRVSSAQG
jgi:hypothetical protein